MSQKETMNLCKEGLSLFSPPDVPCLHFKQPTSPGPCSSMCTRLHVCSTWLNQARNPGPSLHPQQQTPESNKVPSALRVWLWVRWWSASLLFQHWHVFYPEIRVGRGIQKLTSLQFPEWSICIPNLGKRGSVRKHGHGKGINTSSPVELKNSV